MPTYDLSHPLETGMQTYPDDPDVAISPHAGFDADGYRVTALSMGSHTGTHVDAPSHTERDGKTLGEFSLDTFRFDAQVADVRRDARAPIDVADLPEATDADLLVLHTGWDDHWGTDRYLDHPYLTEAAAAWCVEHDYHVATDALNVDPTPSPNASEDEPTGFGAHHTLLGADRLIYENLTGLARVPPRFELHAYPLALDADGAPVRAVADTTD
ncbi:cyclase family protein [Salinigranum halophilum]|jgi:kynurenine formamidase|uniref:cyclase family protein n=1 Tax=Salinigranum halophilum TaxID=2565931 RepID=UPI0010A77478|nr:cyclase family protein [Salinigranum halophilum]